jgi:hypothetical protein
VRWVHKNRQHYSLMNGEEIVGYLYRNVTLHFVTPGGVDIDLEFLDVKWVLAHPDEFYMMHLL